jgi:hypothetical protein
MCPVLTSSLLRALPPDERAHLVAVRERAPVAELAPAAAPPCPDVAPGEATVPPTSASTSPGETPVVEPLAGAGLEVDLKGRRRRERIRAELAAAMREGCAVRLTWKGTPPREGVARALGRGEVSLLGARGPERVLLAAVDEVEVLRTRAAAVRAVLLQAFAAARAVRITGHRGELTARVCSIRAHRVGFWCPGPGRGERLALTVGEILRVEVLGEPLPEPSDGGRYPWHALDGGGEDRAAPSEKESKHG